MEYIGEEEWDACATSGREVNPFLLHAFLELAESSGCAVRDKGWLPQHVLVRNGVTGELLGCCPMYLKGHSYGEYVFDQRWVSRARQAGGRVQAGFQVALHAQWCPAALPVALASPAGSGMSLHTAMLAP